VFEGSRPFQAEGRLFKFAQKINPDLENFPVLKEMGSDRLMSQSNRKTYRKRSWRPRSAVRPGRGIIHPDRRLFSKRKGCRGNRALKEIESQLP